MPPEEIRTIDEQEAAQPVYPRERRGRGQERTGLIPAEGLPHTTDVRSVGVLEMLRKALQFEQERADIRGATPAETYRNAISKTAEAEHTASTFKRLAILEGIHDTLVEEREKVLEQNRREIDADLARHEFNQDLLLGFEYQGQEYESFAAPEYVPGPRRALDDLFRGISERLGIPPDKRKRSVPETLKRFVDLGVRFPIATWFRSTFFGRRLKLEDWGVYKGNRYYPPTETSSDFYDFNRDQLEFHENALDILYRQIEAQGRYGVEGTRMSTLDAMQNVYNFLENLVPYWKEKLSLIDGRREKEELESTRRWLNDIGKIHQQAGGLYGKLTRANLATELPTQIYDHLNNYLTEQGHFLMDQYFTYYEEGRADSPAAQAHFEKTRRLLDLQNELEDLGDSGSDENTRNRVRQRLLDFMQDDHTEFVGEGSLDQPQGKIAELQNSVREKQSTYGDVAAEVNAMIGYIEQQLPRLALPVDDIEAYGRRYVMSDRFRRDHIEPYLEVLRTLNKIGDEGEVLDRLDTLTGFGEDIKGRDLAVLIERVEDGMLPLEGQVDKLLPGGLREAGRAAEIIKELAEERRVLAVEVERQQATEALGLEAERRSREAEQRARKEQQEEQEELDELKEHFVDGLFSLLRIITTRPGQRPEASDIGKLRELLGLIPAEQLSDADKETAIAAASEAIQSRSASDIQREREAKLTSIIPIFSLIFELLGFRS